MLKSNLHEHISGLNMDIPPWKFELFLLFLSSYLLVKGCSDAQL